MKKLISITAVILISIGAALFLSYNAGRRSGAEVEYVRVINAVADAYEYDPSEVEMDAGLTDSDGATVAKPIHRCGVPTKEGPACRRRVKAEGDRCFLHKGSMPERDKR